ncbi:MAG TPA: universal stress protein [Verrucomicrobiae bacterium]|nr:universal stress protein [Verrucomicrobiae bacterium]
MAPVDTKSEAAPSVVGLGSTLSPVSIRNILLATDFSATSEAALPYAAALCRRFGSTLHLAHVLSEATLLMMSGGVDYVSMGTIYDDAEAAAKEKLEHVAARLEGIEHRSYVRRGPVWNSLTGIVQRYPIDLIILGTHGRTGLGKLLLGSVAEDILRHAPCPVLTVGPKVCGHARLPAFPPGRDLAPVELDIRQILVATNCGDNPVVLARTAAALAAEFRARLTLMHVVEDYAHLGTRPELMQKGRERLQALVPKDVALQYPPDVLLEFGSAHEQILKIADDREADFLVLGARSAGEVGTSHLPWSTAHHVIAHAHCPVLTLRG